MSQLVNAEVNIGDRKAVLASNYTLQLRIRECHAGPERYKTLFALCLVGPGVEI